MNQSKILTRFGDSLQIQCAGVDCNNTTWFHIDNKAICSRSFGNFWYVKYRGKDGYMKYKERIWFCPDCMYGREE